MQLPRSGQVAASRGREAATTVLPPALRPLIQLGRIFALPVLALGSGALWFASRRTPDICGALAASEARMIRRRLRARLQALRSTGAPFELSEVVPFSWQRVGVFGPMEDMRAYFPGADRRVADSLQSGDRHLVVLERAVDALVYLIFRASDEIPSANPVCLNGDHILVSRINRDFVDYLDFTVAPPSAIG